ncbi:hypothetical protein ACGCUP_01045 [Eubacteriales bacterium KG125]
MKLKVELFRYGTLVFGKILEQDESLREKAIITQNVEYSIRSIDSPQIRFKKLFVRGCNKTNDNTILNYNFTSLEEAEEWCENIKYLIDELNGQDELSQNSVVRVI